MHSAVYFKACFSPPVALCSSVLLLSFRSIVNGTFTEVREAMFAHMPSLQLL